jgi:hypothetical protein
MILTKDNLVLMFGLRTQHIEVFVNVVIQISLVLTFSLQMLMQFRLLNLELQRVVSSPFADTGLSELHLVRKMMFHLLLYTMLALSLQYGGQTAFSFAFLLQSGFPMLPLQLDVKLLHHVFLYFLLHRYHLLLVFM